jgi:hypothetical protein
MNTVLRFGLILFVAGEPLGAQARPRARDLGVPFDGTPGPLNAITDVAGVTVGHATIISGQGKLVVGQGPVRTGVTAVFPRGGTNGDPVFGGWFTLNGNGEMTGTTWLEESGFLAGPVMITNTHSVGIVRDAVIEWLVKKDSSSTGPCRSLPTPGTGRSTTSTAFTSPGSIPSKTRSRRASMERPCSCTSVRSSMGSS